MSDCAPLEDRILSFVSAAPCRTFVELERHVGHEMTGDRALYLDGYPNIVLWFHLSQAFIKVLEALLAEGLVEMRGTTRLAYLADGKLPALPLARSKRHYKTLRWLPTYLRARAVQPARSAVAGAEKGKPDINAG